MDTAEAHIAADAAAPDADAATKRAYVRHMFSEIAPRYDFLNHLLSFNLDKQWRRRAIAALAWQRVPTGLYVDLCAGTLDVAAQLVGEAGFSGRVIGADFAEPMLRAGARKVPTRTVLPVVADALELPLPNASASGAVVAFGIRNVSDLDATLREVYRILEPRGRLVILEFTTPRSRVVRAAYHLYFHSILPRMGAWISGHRTAYAYLPRSVASFPVAHQLAVRMRAAGLADVQWQTLTLGVAAIHQGTKP